MLIFLLNFHYYKIAKKNKVFDAFEDLVDAKRILREIKLLSNKFLLKKCVIIQRTSFNLILTFIIN